MKAYGEGTMAVSISKFVRCTIQVLANANCLLGVKHSCCKGANRSLKEPTLTMKNN